MTAVNFKSADTTQITDFIDQLARDFFLDGYDRRSEPRHKITVEAGVTLLDSSGTPVGHTTRVITRDISNIGLGMTSPTPLSGRVQVSLSAPSGVQLKAVAEILGCEPEGYYFNIGCKFLSISKLRKSGSNR